MENNNFINKVFMGLFVCLFEMEFIGKYVWKLMQSGHNGTSKVNSFDMLLVVQKSTNEQTHVFVHQRFILFVDCNVCWNNFNIYIYIK